MRNLDNHRYIGEAIQLLQAKGDKIKVPVWYKVVDVILFLITIGIPITLVTWLVKILTY
jgi:ketopantoate hydroxymethyltransferase